jgi:hypothetical protein
MSVAENMLLDDSIPQCGSADFSEGDTAQQFN